MLRVPSLAVPTKKPVGRLRLKKSHPLYKHLIGFFPLNPAHQYEDLCGNFTITSIAESPIDHNRLSQTVTATSYIEWAYNGKGWTSDLTVAWGIDPLDHDNYNCNLNLNGWGTFQMHSSAIGTVYVGTDVSTRFERTNFYANNTYNVHGLYTTNNSDDTQELYKNGNLFATETTVATPALPTDLSIGRADTVTMDQHWHYVAVWARPFEADEARKVTTAGIWDMVEEVEPTSYFYPKLPTLPLADTIRSLNPTRFYTMEESQGESLRDQGTDAATATPVNTLTYRQRSILTSADSPSILFGSTGHFTTSTNTMFFGTSITVTFPYKRNGNPAGISTIFSQYDTGAAEGGILVYVATDGILKISGKVTNSGNYQTTASTRNICDNSEHWCTVLVANNTVSFYIDGELDPVSSGGSFNGSIYNDAIFLIGQVSTANYLIANLQNLAIWDRALSEGQIKRLWNAAKNKIPATSAVKVDEIFLRDTALLLPGHKPVVRVKTDKYHPLSKGLVGCWLFQHTIEGTNQARNIATDTRNNYTDGLAHFHYHPDLGGCTVRGGYTGTDRVQLGSIVAGDPLSLTTTGKFSVYQMGYFQGYVSSSRSPRVIDKSNGGTAGNGWGFWANFTAASDNKLGVGVSGVQVGVSSDLSDYKGGFHGIGVSCRSGAQAFYLDGVQRGTDTGTYTIPTTTTVGALLNWNHAAGRGWPGQVACIFVWNRELTPEEHEMLHYDRYQFLIPA